MQIEIAHAKCPHCKFMLDGDSILHGDYAPEEIERECPICKRKYKMSVKRVIKYSTRKVTKDEV